MSGLMAAKDRQNVLAHLREAKIIAEWNYRQQAQTDGADRDMWSAVLGNVENALNRMGE